MPLWRPSCRHSGPRRSQPAAALGQDPTSRHRRRALAPWRNQRARCVVVGVCCTLLPSLWRLCSGAWRWRTSQCRPAPRVVDGHSEQGGPPSAMRSACSRVYGDFVSAGVLHLNAALLLSRGRILRGALRMTSLWRRTRINFHSAALLSPKPPWVPFSPALAFLPSPQWLDSSGRAAGATESSARGTIRNAVSSRVNVGCVGEAA